MAGLDAHRFAIAELASDLHVDETEVLEANESELGKFLDARIQMFVPLLVGKRVRRKLLDRSRNMTETPWSRETLEDLERTLTRGELTREDPSQCREIITVLKAQREDPKSFDRYGNDEQELIINLIERFEGFC